MFLGIFFEHKFAVIPHHISLSKRYMKIAIGLTLLIGLTGIESASGQPVELSETPQVLVNQYFDANKIYSSSELQQQARDLVINLLRFTAERLLSTQLRGDIKVIENIPSRSQLIASISYDPLRETLIHGKDLALFLESINYLPSFILFSQSVSMDNCNYYLEFFSQNSSLGAIEVKNVRFVSGDGTSCQASELLQKQLSAESKLLLPASLFHFDSVIYPEYVDALKRSQSFSP